MSKPVRRKRALSIVVASLSLSALQAPVISAVQDFRGNAEAFMLQEARAGFCNGTVVTESYAAVSSAQWGGDGNSSCGRCAKIWCVSDGTRECASTTPQVVQVVDRCADCELGDLRVSSSVFQLIADVSSSPTSVQWRYVDCGASDSYSGGALDGDGGEDAADAAEMPQTWTGISFDELDDPGMGEASKVSGSLETGVAGSASYPNSGPDAGSASGPDTGFDAGSDASIDSAWSGSLDSEQWTKPVSTSSAAPTTSTPSSPASDVPSGTPSISATAVSTDTASPSSSPPYPSSATTVPASVSWSYPPSSMSPLPTSTTAPGDYSPSASPPASVDPVHSATDYPVGTVTTPADPPGGNAQETTTDANKNAEPTVSPATSPASTATSTSSTSAESTMDKDRSSTTPSASSGSQHKASDKGGSTKGSSTGSNSPSNGGILGTSTFNRSPIFYASIIVGVVGLVGAIVGYRAKRKRSHRDELRAYQHSIQAARTPTSFCSSHPVPAHPASPAVHVVFL